MLTPLDLKNHAAFYREYYARQAGNGFIAYSGRRVMDNKGIGFLLSGFVKNVPENKLGFLACQTIRVTSDVAEGRNFKQNSLRSVKTVMGKWRAKFSASCLQGKKKARFADARAKETVQLDAGRVIYSNAATRRRFI